jgi:hypothetical protein
MSVESAASFGGRSQGMLSDGADARVEGRFALAPRLSGGAIRRVNARRPTIRDLATRAILAPTVVHLPDLLPRTRMADRVRHPLLASARERVNEFDWSLIVDRYVQIQRTFVVRLRDDSSPTRPVSEVPIELLGQA